MSKKAIDKDYLISSLKSFDENILSKKYSSHSDTEGKSAYEVAKDNGFTGTVTEWLKSLKGEEGDSPYIGENGNWYVGETDSGVSAKPDITIKNDNWYINGKDSNIPIPTYTDILRYVDKKASLQDTPVGHIIAHMGTAAPQHYLACDGSVYNISDYPELANHFAADFGNAGYFGGDGVTTFAVPDLRSMFLRGSGTNNAIIDRGYYGYVDTSVGESQEGTNITPFYTNNNTHTFVVTSEDTGMGCINDADYKCRKSNIITELFLQTNSFNQGSTLDSYSDFYFWNTRWTFRPINTSVLYCIKAKPTYYMDFSGATIMINGESVNNVSTVSQEDIQSAVGDYFMNNPSPVTVSTVEQVQNNTNAIESIKDDNKNTGSKIEQIAADTDYLLMMSGLD